jgi:hypothetical protein
MFKSFHFTKVIIIGLKPCAIVTKRNYFKRVLAKSFMEIYVINANNMVSGKYQSKQQGDSSQEL